MGNHIENVIEAIIASIIGTLLYMLWALLWAWPLMWGWNYVIPYLFGLPELHYWQMYWLYVVVISLIELKIIPITQYEAKK